MRSADWDAGFFENRRARGAALSAAQRLADWQIQGFEAGRYSGGAPVAVV
jgi:hypothetical protein